MATPTTTQLHHYHHHHLNDHDDSDGYSKNHSLVDMRNLHIKPEIDGETEVQLVSQRHLMMLNSHKQASQNALTVLAKKLTLKLRILRGHDLPPMKKLVVQVAVLDDMDTDLCESNLGSVGPINTSKKRVLDHENPIWGGPNSSWEFDCHPSSTRLVFVIRDEAVRGNRGSSSHQLMAKVPITDLLYFKGNAQRKNRNPNTWIQFPASPVQPAQQDDNNEEEAPEVPRIQIRLTRNTVRATLHDQQNCRNLTAGPALKPSVKTSYAARKLALYCCAPVLLNVYDVSNQSNIRRVNNATKLCGYGGIFHGGIEIYGREYSFGGSRDPRAAGKTGVFACVPKSCPMHHYRETVYLGDCELLPSQVNAILQDLRPLWLAHSYDLFKKNCCFFSREFAIQLGVGDIPMWVYSLAQTAESIEPYLVQIEDYFRRRTAASQSQPAEPQPQRVTNSAPWSATTNHHRQAAEHIRASTVVAGGRKKSSSGRLAGDEDLGEHLHARDVQQCLLDHAMAYKIQQNFRASMAANKLLRNQKQTAAQAVA